MTVTYVLLQKNARFYGSKARAVADAKARKGVVIQALRGRLWVAVSGAATIRESLKRLRESSAYLGKAPPKIVRDYRR